ncbi:MAG: hypothetical protein KDJ97_35085 [Anaerolineae bacterium]|nr:hypothetical protein [Anaerolineae bacterium]
MPTENVPLLRTKLHRPEPGPGHIPRPHLLNYLNHNSQRKLTLVSAPAGFGKTTLMAEWLQIGPRQVAWLSLDEADRNFVRFMRYIVAALQTIWPAMGLDLMSLLRAPKLPPVPYLATSLINDLVDRPEPFVLVLDDVHLVESAEITQFLEMVIEYFPPQGQLVLITRVDPSLPLARLRARSHMAEIRATELRFDAIEIDAFLKQRQPDTLLSPEAIATLVERTEGWITGVQLAYLSLYHHPDPTRFVEQFAGTDRYVMEYLVDEVLSRQPPNVRSFLLRTSILDQICASLGEALMEVEVEDTFQPTGDEVRETTNEARPTTETILETIRQANLFLIPLDTEAKWYRYHHLFQSLLEHWLQTRCSAQAIAALHAQAGRWLAGQGYIEEALDHILAAGELEQAAQLVEKHRHKLLNKGQVIILAQWLEKLPEPLIERRSALLLARAWVYRHRHGAPSGYAALLPQIEALLHHQPHTAEVEALWGELYSLQSGWSYFQGDGQRAIRQAEQGLSKTPPDQTFVRGNSVVNLSIAYRLVGRGEEAKHELIQALHENHEQSPTYALRLYTPLNTVYLGDADFFRMAQTGAYQLKLAEKEGLTIEIGWGNIFCGGAAYEHNDLAAAAHYFSRITERPYSVEYLTYSEAAYGLVMTYLAQDQLDQANWVVDQLVELMLAQNRQPNPLLADWLQVRLALRKGDIRAARRLVLPPTFEPERESMMGLMDGQGRTLAKLRLAQRTAVSLAEAARILQQLLSVADACFNNWRKIEILAMQALVDEAQGAQERALERLTQAVTLGQPGGVIRTFVDLGPHLVPLLQALATRKVAPTYIAAILAAFPASDLRAPSAPRPDHSSAPELIEPLTDRELEILDLLVQRYTNKEIARRLVISPFTVKKHTTNIYQKLQVKGRRQAVAKAKEFDLVPNGH